MPTPENPTEGASPSKIPVEKWVISLQFFTILVNERKIASLDPRSSEGFVRKPEIHHDQVRPQSRWTRPRTIEMFLHPLLPALQTLCLQDLAIAAVRWFIPMYLDQISPFLHISNSGRTKSLHDPITWRSQTMPICHLLLYQVKRHLPMNCVKVQD